MRTMLGAAPLARPTIVLALLAATLPALAAGDDSDRSESYAIGHTTMVRYRYIAQSRRFYSDNDRGTATLSAHLVSNFG